ncbi:MAG: threonine/serine exporter family protein [Clostridiales bacterium]|nr:threonine/serine exporter family protein [Clostridiales bacterium]
MENIIKDNIAPEAVGGDKQLYDRVLNVAIETGASILSNGGSVSRVETAIERICSAYGAKETNVFAIPSMIIACIKLEDGNEYTQIKRLYSTGNNIAMMEKYNQLSRDICYSKLSLQDAELRLEELKACKQNSKRITILGGAIVAGAFNVYFGGALIDFIPAFIIGALLSVINLAFSVRAFNGYARAFMLSLIGGIITILTCYLLGLMGIECHVSMIMVGNIMLVIPGLLVTNAVRDLFTGDLVTGSIQLLNGVIVTLAIVAGYTVSLLLLGNLSAFFEAPIREFGTIEYYAPVIIFCIVGAFGVDLLFNISFKRVAWGLVNTLITFIIYLLMEYYTRDLFLTNFVATLFAAFFAEFLARWKKAPATVFLIPAIIPFVPGASLYFTMNYLVSGDMANAASKGTDALLIFLGIAVGLSVITLIFQLIYPIKNKIHIKHRLFKKNKQF